MFQLRNKMSCQQPLLRSSFPPVATAPNTIHVHEYLSKQMVCGWLFNRRKAGVLVAVGNLDSLCCGHRPNLQVQNQTS
jgi:hypothetical protein